MSQNNMQSRLLRRFRSTATGTLLTLVSAFSNASITSTVLNEQAGFQAVTWVNNTVLVSGTHGSAYLSSNNGKQFRKVDLPAGTEALQFRDNQWFSDGSIVLMSAGEGEQSRLYHSVSQGKDWQLVKQGEHEHVFFDCMTFDRDGNGWLYGDSDSQGLYIQHSENGGKDWSRQVMPIAAQESEGGFASSGTCIAAAAGVLAAGTGNSAQPGLLIKNNGEGWQRIATLFEGGEAAGIFSIQINNNLLYAFGGSLKHQLPATAFTYDMGKAEWQALPTLPLTGAVYGSALYYPGQNNGVPDVLISNPQGVFLLHHGSKQWSKLSESNIWSLACKSGVGCIGVGKGGVVEQYSHTSMSGNF